MDIHLIGNSEKLLDCNQKYRMLIANFHNQVEGDYYPYEEALAYYKAMGKFYRANLSKSKLKKLNQEVRKDMAIFNKSRGLFNRDII